MLLALMFSTNATVIEPIMFASASCAPVPNALSSLTPQGLSDLCPPTTSMRSPLSSSVEAASIDWGLRTPTDSPPFVRLHLGLTGLEVSSLLL